MNARVKTITGSFNVVGQITDDKIDQLAALLGLSDEEKQGLKNSPGLIVVEPIPDAKS